MFQHYTAQLISRSLGLSERVVNKEISVCSDAGVTHGIAELMITISRGLTISQTVS